MEKIRKKNIIYKILLICILIFSVYVRTKLYIVSDLFEDDECRLAIAMFDRNIWQMFLPLGALSSSPLFMFVSYIIANYTNYNEHALKLIPYISSVASVFLFYKISYKFFRKKFLTLISLFLFSINWMVIEFSAYFKQYSLELFMGLVCLYYFYKLNIKNLSIIQLLFFAVFITICPLIALPTVFYITTLFIINLMKNRKSKEFYKKLFIPFIPFSITMLLYYFYNLAPSKLLQMNLFKEYWGTIFEQGFINMIKDFLSISFIPNSFYFFPLSLILLSITVIITKKRKRYIDIFITILTLIVLSIAFFNIYPLFNRTGLFFVPILILLLCKSLESFNIRKIYSYIVIAAFLISIGKYLAPQYYKNILNADSFMIKQSPKSLIIDLNNKYNPQTDEVLTNEASFYMYWFYVRKLNLVNLVDVRIISNDDTDNGETLFKYLNNLDNNHAYWFYLIKDFVHSPDRENIANWLRHQNVVYFKNERQSGICCIIPPIRKFHP